MTFLFNPLVLLSHRIPDARVYRCQQHSIFQMLNEGIRVFDLRYAYNPGLDTIGFYHCRLSLIIIFSGDRNSAVARKYQNLQELIYLFIYLFSSQSVVESYNENGRCLLWIVLLAWKAPYGNRPGLNELWTGYRHAEWRFSPGKSV